MNNENVEGVSTGLQRGTLLADAHRVEHTAPRTIEQARAGTQSEIAKAGQRWWKQSRERVYCYKNILLLGLCHLGREPAIGWANLSRYMWADVNVLFPS